MSYNLCLSLDFDGTSDVDDPIAFKPASGTDEANGNNGNTDTVDFELSSATGVVVGLETAAGASVLDSKGKSTSLCVSLSLNLTLLQILFLNPTILLLKRFSRISKTLTNPTNMPRLRKTANNRYF